MKCHSGEREEDDRGQREEDEGCVVLVLYFEWVVGFVVDDAREATAAAADSFLSLLALNGLPIPPRSDPRLLPLLPPVLLFIE